MSDIDRLIPIIEALSSVGMRRTKGYAEIAAGRLKVIRNGRRTFIRASEVERYISTLETSDTKQAA